VKTKKAIDLYAGAGGLIRAGTGADRGSFQAVRPIYHSSPRAIALREAARLQGFSDWFQLGDTNWHASRRIGNNVSPIMAEALLGSVHAAAG
jgi:DNA (cytosine-5)-methyltransferase 1